MLGSNHAGPRASRVGAGEVAALLLTLCLSGCILVGYDGQVFELRADGGPSDTGSWDQAEAGPGDDGRAEPKDPFTDDLDAQSDADANQDLDATSPVDATYPIVDAGEPPDEPEGGLEPEDDSGAPEPDAGGPWWTDVPPTQPCSSITCSQKCAVQSSPCVFNCNEISCNPTCLAETRCHSTCSGSSCTHSCGANAECDTVCSALQCSETCAAGSTCDLTCNGSTTCNMNCTTGASCLLKCATAGLSVCSIGCAAGGRTCPGNIYTCNRDCPAP